VENYTLYGRMKVVIRKAMEDSAVMADGAEPPAVQHRYPTRRKGPIEGKWDLALVGH